MDERHQRGPAQTRPRTAEVSTDLPIRRESVKLPISFLLFVLYNNHVVSLHELYQDPLAS